MWARMLFFPLACALLISGCASASPTIYSLTPLRGVSTWDIGFAFETGAAAETRDNAGKGQTTVVRGGQPIRNLQLRDNLYFILQDKYSIPVTKSGTPRDGAIRLVPVDFTFGGFATLDVRFEDSVGKILARLLIRNSDRNCCFKNDEKFAQYAGQKIAELLRPEQRP